MERRIAIAVVIFVTMVSMVISIVVSLVSHIEVGYIAYNKILAMTVPMNLLIHYHAWIWLFQAAILIAGIDIIRREKCDLAYLIWYITLSLLFMTLWSAFSVIAFFHSYDFYLLAGPLSSP